MKKLFGMPRCSAIRGITIEYAVVMMLLAVAFVGLLLTLAMESGEQAGEYYDYIERKALLDDAASAFIGAQGRVGCTDEFTDNAFGVIFSVSYTEFVAREKGLGGSVLLRVVLEREDSDGDGVRAVVSYIYGLA